MNYVSKGVQYLALVVLLMMCLTGCGKSAQSQLEDMKIEYKAESFIAAISNPNEKNNKIVDLFLEDKFDLLKATDNGDSPLLAAARMNNVKVLKRAIEQKLSFGIEADRKLNSEKVKGIPITMLLETENTDILKALEENGTITRVKYSRPNPQQPLQLSQNKVTLKVGQSLILEPVSLKDDNIPEYHLAWDYKALQSRAYQTAWYQAGDYFWAVRVITAKAAGEPLEIGLQSGYGVAKLTVEFVQ